MVQGRKVRIKDVAESAGVANSTVSHVLNGTASISPEVREKVLAAARTLGYLAKREAKANIPILGSVLLAVNQNALQETETNLFSWTLLNALTEDCKRRGVKLVPYPSTEQLDADIVVGVARDAKVDGILIINEDKSEFLNAVQASGIPSVLINGEDQGMQVDSVAPGNRFAAQMATNYLLDRGHRKILHLTWDGRTTIDRRADGFIDAFRSRGAKKNAIMLRVGGFDPRFGDEAVEEWIADHQGMDGVTAIFAASDNLAIGAIRALNRNGIRVPDDVSVLGFDGVSLGDLVKPSLTTVRVPLEQIGPAALSMLEDRLARQNEGRVAHRLELGCSIIERESVSAQS